MRSKGLGVFSLMLTVVFVVPLVLELGACTQKKDRYAFAEQKHPDWEVLRKNVREYEAARSALNTQNLLVIQSNFRDLTERHSNDLIGDEATFYVGRIYYDIRDYHDARRIFAFHAERFPNSPFRETIAKLEEEMDAEQARYEKWLEKSRTVSGN